MASRMIPLMLAAIFFAHLVSNAESFRVQRRVTKNLAVERKQSQSLTPSAANESVSQGCRKPLRNFRCFTDDADNVLCGMARPDEYNQRCSPAAALVDAKAAVLKFGRVEKPLALISIDRDHLDKIQIQAGIHGIAAYSSGCRSVRFQGSSTVHRRCFRNNRLCTGCKAPYHASIRGQSSIVTDWRSPSTEQLASYVELVDHLKEGTAAVGGVKHHVLTHCAGGMGRTGIHLMAYEAYSLLKNHGREYRTFESAMLKAMTDVQTKYHCKAGEFTDVHSNFDELMDFVYAKLGQQDFVPCLAQCTEHEFAMKKRDFRDTFFDTWQANKMSLC